MNRGIAGAGMYLPRFRLPRDELSAVWGHVGASGIEQKTVPAADEDTITMAIAAGERAIGAANRSANNVDVLILATTTPPMAEEALMGRLVRALGLRQSVETYLETGSTLAGARSISNAHQANGVALTIASDCPRGELDESDHRFGAGAAAFIITDGAPNQLGNFGWYAEERAGIRFRSAVSGRISSLGVSSSSREAWRTGITAAVNDAADDGTWEDAAGVAIHQPNARVPLRVAGSIPVDGGAIENSIVVDRTGDLGAAMVPVALALSIEENLETDQPIGACFFGGGSAAAFLLSGENAPVSGSDSIDECESIDYPTYLRLRGELGEGGVAGGGANISLTDWEHDLDARYQLVIGKCRDCGELTFPPTGACRSCHSRGTLTTVEPDPLGTIAAVTTIRHGGAPPEFAPQQRRGGSFAVAIVELTHGDHRVRVPAQLTDVEPDAVAIGDQVTGTIRRLYAQEGIARYGIKFTPVGQR